MFILFFDLWLNSKCDLAVSWKSYLCPVYLALTLFLFRIHGFVSPSNLKIIKMTMQILVLIKKYFSLSFSFVLHMAQCEIDLIDNKNKMHETKLVDRTTQ